MIAQYDVLVNNCTCGENVSTTRYRYMYLNPRSVLFFVWYDNTVNTLYKRNILEQEFFDQDTLVVAQKLLGKFLVRHYRGKDMRLMIVETEAYDGPDDKASHASRGKTPRNAPMFGPPGMWYVYLCYGMHEMLNVVTGPEGYPSAVLIRGVAGHDGPGKLTKALHIGRSMNDVCACPASGLWIEEGVSVQEEDIVRLPRVGVAYAGHDWSTRPYRFRISC